VLILAAQVISLDAAAAFFGFVPLPTVVCMDVILQFICTQEAASHLPSSWCKPAALPVVSHLVLQWQNTPPGRFVLGPADGAYATCMCANATTHGDVIMYNTTSHEYYCVPGAQFLADAPGSSTGVWVPALQPSQQICNSAQECYDMCFYCDGSPRYQATVSWVLS
jgi:hypothetical protein